MPDNNSLYRSLYRIRRFEEVLLEKFSTGVFRGTTHTYIGQEANAVGVLAHRQDGDIVFSNHRCHGHFLAYGGDMRALFAELMGKATGVCGGRGGSQHLHWLGFYSNGVLGSTAPVAAGTALAEKLKGSHSTTVLFLGDGAFGEGVVYETLNMAALWAVPILFIVENNHIAQTTPLAQHLAGDFPGRFAAFGIPVRELDTSDVNLILSAAQDALGGVRKGEGPQALVLHTCRFGPHSKGDDTRTAAALERMRQTRDPVTIHGARLERPERMAIEDLVNQEVEAAFAQALGDPYPESTESANQRESTRRQS
jgi:TPP-dependent pyruvate/acetoin dehydrogenase alpha subunit